MQERNKNAEANLDRTILMQKLIIGLMMIEEVVIVPAFIYSARLLTESNHNVGLHRVALAVTTIGIVSGVIGAIGSYLKMQDAKQEKAKQIR